MSVHLGVDIGSTRTKLILWDETDSIVGRASAPTPVVRGAVDRRDHEAVWGVLTGLAAELPPSLRREVVAVAVASVGEEIVLLSEEGRSLRPTPCWYTLSPLHTDGDSVRRILSWQLFADLRAAASETLSDAASFTDLGSGITMRLAGLPAAEAVMDRSHASRTGLLTPDGDWDADQLRASGAALVTAPPRLVESGAQVGVIAPDVAEAWGLPHGVRIHAGGHDHFCGALAAGVRRAGDVFVSVGTSESIVQLIDRARLRTIEDPGEHGFYVVGGLGYLHRSQPSGREIAGLLETHRGPDIADLYAEIAGSGGASISPAATALDAALRRQAQSSAELVAVLTRTSGVPARRIVIGGVPVTSPHWRELRRRALDGEVEFIYEPELAGTGAAMLAATTTENER
ncbi:FGGY family carbohydrate kinase [Zhihengliuella sp. ISTPL4]|uniref:FGGY family carbohydrate kinase n=1 Tax=Zhihengliuella sp. ISTPL4 TaxID=2058657 RepID=UPI000C7CFC6B|nr:FGGY family carbohydrate kinase [Zhihengliuella sp. ISTPL4]